MCRDDDISSEIKRTQETIFRKTTATRKCLEMDTELSKTTLGSYARGEAVMSVASLRKLLPHMEPDLLSLLLGDDFQIVQIPKNLDHDTFAEGVIEFLQMKTAAHHPDSENGPAIGPNECKDLTNARAKIARIK